MSFRNKSTEELTKYLPFSKWVWAVVVEAILLPLFVSILFTYSQYLFDKIPDKSAFNFWNALTKDMGDNTMFWLGLLALWFVFMLFRTYLGLLEGKVDKEAEDDRKEIIKTLKKIEARLNDRNNDNPK